MFKTMNKELIIYLIVSLGAVALLSIIIQIIIKVSLNRRTVLIEKLKETEVVETTTPLEKPTRAFKTLAKKNLRARFSIFKRVAISISVLSFIFMATFPYIDKLPQTFVSILVGSAAIITGMAAKPFIENFLSGIAITASRMLKIGDTIIINDNYGTIEDISSTHTVVKIWNWRRYVIPNSSMINTDFINLTLNDKWLWSHVEFYVSYETNIRSIKEIAIETVQNCKHFNNIEPPSFWVMKTEKDSVKCWVAAWATSPADAWELEAEIRTNLIMKLQENNIQCHINYHNVKNT